MTDSNSDDYSARRRAAHQKRHEQMSKVLRLRPFWQLVGACAGEGERRTLPASDPFWQGDTMPWRCQRGHCECEVFSLSRVELQMYVENGVAPGDEAAKNLLTAA